MQLATETRPRPRLSSLRVALIVVLAVLAGATAFALSPSSWQSHVTITIVPPQTGPNSPLAQNPLLRLDDNLQPLVTVLAASLRTPAADTALRRQGGAGSFAIATGAGSSQGANAIIDRTPQLMFTAESGSAGLARRTAVALVSVARDQLYGLQTRTAVPGAARATIAVLAAPTPAVRDDDARWTTAGRAALAVAVLLGGAWFLTARRRRPR